MNIFLTWGRTLLGYFLLVFVAIFFFLPAVILSLILPADKRHHSTTFFWLFDKVYKGIVWCMFVPVTIKGKENIPTEPAIFAANHESVLDIPLMGSLLNGHPHVWFVLARFAKTPFLGTIVRRMFIPVDQDCSMQSARALIQGIRIIKEQALHTIIFPEGGRFNDGTVHDFFGGFAVLAEKTGRPVVPVMLFNVGKIYPPGSFLVHYYPVTVIIGQPMIKQPDETAEAFSARVHHWFKAHTQ